MAVNPQIFTPQIQGLQLENPMTFARNALAMRESQASAAANQLKVARATKAANVLAANKNKSVEEIANALLREGLPDEAKGFVDYATSRSQAGKAAREQEVAGLALLGSEAGAFANDPTSLNKASIMPWAQNAVKRGLMSPDALARFEAMPDDPQQLSVAMRRLQVQALTPVQQLETTVTEQDLGGESRYLRIPKLGGRAEEVEGSRETITRSPNRQVTNINLPPLEKEERGEKGKLNVRIYEDIRNRASSAGRLLPKIRASRAVLDKGFETGLFAPAKAEAARFLSAIGVEDAADFAADAQTFKATAQERVLERQLEQKGVQTTSDAARMEQTFARLGNEVEANRFLFDIAEAQAKYEIETRKFWDDWWNKNGTYEGVEDAWDKAGGSKSIFDDPKLKKYLEPSQAQPTAAPVRVKSVEEAKKLPAGTVFITPDGRTKVR